MTTLKNRNLAYDPQGLYEDNVLRNTPSNYAVDAEERRTNGVCHKRRYEWGKSQAVQRQPPAWVNHHQEDIPVKGASMAGPAIRRQAGGEKRVKLPPQEESPDQTKKLTSGATREEDKSGFI